MTGESWRHGSTAYIGPIKVSTFAFSDRSVRLVRPADPDQLLDTPDVLEWSKRDDYMPYWAYLWPGALLLAGVVAHEPGLSGHRALEIGCGLGLAGLVGLSRGLSVRFTDYDMAPLGFVVRSAEANGFDAAAFSTARLDWRELPDERYPLILAADVLYERRLVPLVANLLARMLEPEGVALVADPNRVAALGFEGELTSRGLICETQSIQLETSELGPLTGTLHRVRHRPG